MMIETAELLELFRYKTEKEVEELFTDPVKRTQISDEIADVTFNILRFCHQYDFDLSTIYQNKLRKNELKYPIEKCKGKCTKYTEL